MVVACGALGDVQMGGEVMSKKFHDLNRGGHSAEGGRQCKVTIRVSCS